MPSVSSIPILYGRRKVGNIGEQ